MTSMYKMMQKLWRERPEALRSQLRKRMVAWRRMRAVERVEKPLRIDRARELGYKAKQGYVVALVRVRRGGFSKPRPRSGRRQKALGVVRHKVNVSMKEEAVQRFIKHFPNLKPLGAYPLAQDSLYRWYEVVAVDPSHPAVQAN
ncbi:large subunit ribosomal protein L15e [Candidatus Caldarchaeum subterraneum]|uniref:50S ribosomal protein L15e n=1 Tax=Caldiarchaeum subterraneum TaxID=311458 RepID=E6N5A3_CALS0|nr:large subunit ribosomal protein L15e [Candidatus Caldarchaeum subterraneum]BAJ47495.1 large subunit ribosomal protein L15e [Candidatus Caldarchaeum subterraneum]BAJ49296.1 large subunit ribosomal protein L15e [Candidatus Caldarchaeum subterraneum]BAJ50311.1 large subunit ribosomal protein L15e [Candidatus Caldarchaeum subterraneum]